MNCVPALGTHKLTALSSQYLAPPLLSFCLAQHMNVGLNVPNRRYVVS